MSPAPGVLSTVRGVRVHSGSTFQDIRSTWVLSQDEPPLTVGRDAAGKAARDELAKRMYHKNDPSLFQRALDAVWDWLDRLFTSAAGATPGGGLGLAVVVIAVLLVLAALRWRLGAPRRTGATSPALFGERPLSAAEHRSAAEAHAAQGHWKAAVQERMRAMVRSLEERALLDARPGHTADEAATEAGHALPPYATRLSTAAHTFDEITYGGRAATREMYDELTGLDQEIADARPVLLSDTPAGTPEGMANTRQGVAG